jgi:hypothetical protein
MVTVQGYAPPGACRSIFPKGNVVMHIVYVLSPDRVPLMPCSCAIARLLLKQGKARVVHHIIFRSAQGSDEEANLLTLCKTCHDALHAGAITLKHKGAKKGTLLHATQMNSIRIQLLQRVPAEETWGFVTKEHRLLAGLPKNHSTDAAVIATRGTSPVFRTHDVLVKKCIPEGDYQQTKGKRSEQRITTGKIAGFRKFDKVRYLGQEYFIKGRMSTGYAILMGIDGKKVNLKPIPKFVNMQRVSARSSWMIGHNVFDDSR